MPATSNRPVPRAPLPSFVSRGELFHRMGSHHQNALEIAIRPLRTLKFQPQVTASLMIQTQGFGLSAAGQSITRHLCDVRRDLPEWELRHGRRIAACGHLVQFSPRFVRSQGLS